MKPKIFILAGAKGCGKDYTAKIIQKKLDKVSNFKTAVIIKRLVESLMKVNAEDAKTLYSPFIDESGKRIKGRELTIMIGEAIENKLKNNVPEFYGVTLSPTNFLAMRELEEYMNRKWNVVVSDLRIWSTYLCIKNMAKHYEYDYYPIYIWNDCAERNKGKHWTETFFEDNLEEIKKEFKILKNTKEESYQNKLIPQIMSWK